MAFKAHVLRLNMVFEVFSHLWVKTLCSVEYVPL